MADIKRSGRRSGAKRAVEQTKPVEGVIPSANPDGLEPHEAAPDKPRSGYKVVGFAPPSTMKPGGMGVGNAGAAIRRSVVVGAVESVRRVDGPKPPEPISPVWPGPPPIPSRKPAAPTREAEPVGSSDENRPLLFEVAWEVCWQLGGIYTVMRSKAPSMVAAWGDRYCLVGPYNAETAAVEMESCEPTGMLAEAVKRMRELGVSVHCGYWLIEGRPRVILLDYGAAFNRLGEFKYMLWKDHGIQTHDDDGDTNNVVAFGFLTGLLFQEISRVNDGKLQIVAHFHEWMAGLGLMRIAFLKLAVATVFTTHATLLGRYLCTDNPDFYAKLDSINPDHAAGHYRIYPRYCIEHGAANCADVFTTVSDVTALEAEKLLHRKPDVVTPNGLNIRRFEALHEFQTLHRQYKEAIHSFVAAHFFPSYTFDLDRTLYLFTAEYPPSPQPADASPSPPPWANTDNISPRLWTARKIYLYHHEAEK